MIRAALAFLVFAGFAGAAAAAPASPGRLTVVDGGLRLAVDGDTLGSAALVGAEIVLPVALDGGVAEVPVRIDAVVPAAENAAILLHVLSMAGTGGARIGYCAADLAGRNAAIAVAGRIDARGQFVADPRRFFLACTSGAVGKCVLWGYDPWRRTAGGGSLARHYSACLHMVRADYTGDNLPHTRDGTSIDIADDAGVQRWDSETDAAYAFEAGWAPGGAVCVARTRWRDLAAHADLVRARPALGGTCDRVTARKRGALLFTRVKVDPGTPPSH